VRTEFSQELMWIITQKIGNNGVPSPPRDYSIVVENKIK